MRTKIAEYLLDISKLVFAGVVLASIFELEGFSKLTILLAGGIATFIIAIAGFLKKIYIKK